MFYFLCFTLLSVLFVNAANECNPRDYDHGSIVCVCNAEYCDTIDKVEIVDGGKYATYTSNKAGLRFNLQYGDISKYHNQKVEALAVTIDHSAKYQSILGFGGAFTDSAGININNLNDKTKELLLKSYFHAEGLEYNFGRVPIGGTDFSTHAYSYNDGDEDVDLNNFALTQEDHELKIPLIKQAQAISDQTVQLLASAWTAPKWMKTNGEYTGGYLKDEMYQVWANYHLKFLEEYEKEGLQFWGMSTGNEPSLRFVPSNGINTVGWKPENMSYWISENFGPTIREKYEKIKLVTLDDQRFFLPWWPEQVLVNQPAAEYIDGIALHWYWDFIIPDGALDRTHEILPDTFMLATESCRGDKIWESPVSLGDWSRAEDYGHYLIKDLQHWVSGWIDWNLALDMEGGPCYIGNQVDATIIVNATGGEFYKQPTYYAMGHFSKFIPKNSRRVHHESEGDLEVVAFERPDGATAVIILNRNDEETSISIKDDIYGQINSILTPNSFTTFVYGS